MKETKVIIPDDMGTTIVYNSTGKEKWEVNHDNTLTKTADGKLSVANTGGGLDCATIGKLPLSAWKKGTTVLAQQDGNCVRLVPKETLFQEIGVAMTADKLVADVGQTYHVVTTVTNSGEGANEQSDLVITKPALGNYSIANITTRANNATIEKIDDTHFSVKNMQSGGTAVVEFDVVANSGGTFQFGASVNPNTELDLQSNNNQATITLSARIIENPEIVPSVDCPIIDVTVDGHKLVSHSKKYGIFPAYYLPKTIFMNKESLAGLVLKIKQDVTVIVQTGNPTSYSSAREHTLVFKNGTVMLPSVSYSIDEFVEVTDPASSSFNDYTFVNGTLIIGQTVKSAVRVSVRPKGKNCKWQHFDILPNKWVIQIPKTLELSTTLNHTKSKVDTGTTVSENSDDAYKAQVIASYQVIGGTLDFDDVDIKGYYFKPITAEDKLTITLPSGQVTSGTITATGDYLRDLNTNGNIKCVYDPSTKKVTVTTLASVSAADNFTYRNITFKVV